MKGPWGGSPEKKRKKAQNRKEPGHPNSPQLPRKSSLDGSKEKEKGGKKREEASGAGQPQGKVTSSTWVHRRFQKSKTGKGGGRKNRRNQKTVTHAPNDYEEVQCFCSAGTRGGTGIGVVGRTKVGVIKGASLPKNSRGLITWLWRHQSTGQKRERGRSRLGTAT